MSQEILQPVSQDGNAKPTNARWVVLVFLALAAGSAYLTRNCIAVANTTIQSELKFTEDQMGWILGAFGAGYFAQYIPAAYLKGFLATMLMLFAAKVIFGFKARKSTSSSERRWLFPLAGALAGAVSGLTGVGAGLILGPIMISLALTDNEKMSPTQNGVMVFTTIFAMLAYLRWPQEDAWTFGFVHFDIVLPVVIGASLSAALGRRWQSRVQADQRRLILGVMLLALSLKTMYAVLV